MKSDHKIIVKPWNELTPDELSEMNKSHAREWKTSSMSPDHHGENIFFLLKDFGDNILAQGQLVPINGVIFNDEIFNIFGIGGIIANVKGEGYGKKIMLAIKEYLQEHNKTGVGLTNLDGFYEKCGFLVNKNAIKRFVYIIDGKKVVNNEADRICYLDLNDKFVEKVLTNFDKEVYLPRNPDW